MRTRPNVTTAAGWTYQLVPSRDLLSLSHDEAVELLRRAFDDPATASFLCAYASTRGLDPGDREPIVKELASDLASGALIAIVQPTDALGSVDGGAERFDWDDLPSISDLRPTETHSLGIELVDHDGQPFAGVELLLAHAGGDETVVLDERGRWTTNDVRGTARLQLPSELALPSVIARRQPPQAFSLRSDDIQVPRRPFGSLPVTLDRTNRIVVQAPALQPTMTLRGSLFASESSFPGPGIVHLVTSAQEATDRDPKIRLGLFGHTDLTDDVVANKQLADRRARIAWAVVTGDYATFAEIAQAESWPVASYQTMLRVLGCNPTAIDGEGGTQTALAVRAFRRAYNRSRWHDEERTREYGDLPDGDALDDATKLAVLDAYHAELSGRVAAERFIGPAHSGCGEFNPIAKDHTENRRVTLAVYGSDAPLPADFPCVEGDAAACLVDEGGSFRCRFYRHRIREEDHDLERHHFWDFQWLRTESGKAHLSALTDLSAGLGMVGLALGAIQFAVELVIDKSLPGTRKMFDEHFEYACKDGPYHKGSVATEFNEALEAWRAMNDGDLFIKLRGPAGEAGYIPYGGHPTWHMANGLGFSAGQIASMFDVDLQSVVQARIPLGPGEGASGTGVQGG